MTSLPRYRDRHEAGARLGAALRERWPGGDAVVLALPRGGVPVGLEVARALKLPLDVFLVRKLGVPAHPELAFGAIASGGTTILNDDIIAAANLSTSAMLAVARQEAEELDRRERLYRGTRAAVPVRGRTVVLVDDGLATGASMRAALTALRRRGPAALIVAVPVGAPETCARLRADADAVVCPLQPEELLAVGEWYDDFAATTDDEVRSCLEAAPAPPRTP